MRVAERFTPPTRTTTRDDSGPMIVEWGGWAPHYTYADIDDRNQVRAVHLHAKDAPPPDLPSGKWMRTGDDGKTWSVVQDTPHRDDDHDPVIPPPVEVVHRERAIGRARITDRTLSWDLQNGDGPRAVRDIIIRWDAGGPHGGCGYNAQIPLDATPEHAGRARRWACDAIRQTYLWDTGMRRPRSGVATMPDGTRIASTWQGVLDLVADAHPDWCRDTEGGGICRLPQGHAGDHEYAVLRA